MISEIAARLLRLDAPPTVVVIIDCSLEDCDNLRRTALYAIARGSPTPVETLRATDALADSGTAIVAASSPSLFGESPVVVITDVGLAQLPGLGAALAALPRETRRKIIVEAPKVSARTAVASLISKDRAARVLGSTDLTVSPDAVSAALAAYGVPLGSATSVLLRHGVAGIGFCAAVDLIAKLRLVADSVSSDSETTAEAAIDEAARLLLAADSGGEPRDLLRQLVTEDLGGASHSDLLFGLVRRKNVIPDRRSPVTDFAVDRILSDAERALRSSHPAPRDLLDRVALGLARNGGRAQNES